ncbi:MAG TPA: DUF1016 N-terminal domain-containing protein [Candidatus Omnitrophota bacterium]|jgi:endonuclease YncB( thermonuclease family)|nr:DUF1016 N-terminal domain-containing protein [Candidatus Omnitrophota bacterium]HQB94104.1 DUF1016 N-terminal domain-containing protein [Candidatus Omnitrophota bacterium]
MSGSGDVTGKTKKKAVGGRSHALKLIPDTARTLAFAMSLIFISPAALPAAQAPASSSAVPEVATYTELLAAIRKARAASEARVEAAVEQEKVREVWETGRLIDEHILLHKERADYGEQVMARLAGDLETSRSELYRMLEFYRAYPIFAHARKLNWSDYRDLLGVNDVKARDVLAERAENEKWTRERLRDEIRKLKTEKEGADPAPRPERSDLSAPEVLRASPGKPGTYRYVKATVGPEAGRNVIDLGFSNYYRTSRELSFRDGALIETLSTFREASSPSDKIRLSRRAAADLYTYRAWIVRVLDGDTVKAVIDLGFGVRSTQVLRLRGIDAPELVSADGKKAKEFLEKKLGLAEGEGLSDRMVLVRTEKSDKYDRYLADLFYTDKNGREIYLNQEILAAGLAIRMGE